MYIKRCLGHSICSYSDGVSKQLDCNDKINNQFPTNMIYHNLACPSYVLYPTILVYHPVFIETPIYYQG